MLVSCCLYISSYYNVIIFIEYNVVSYSEYFKSNNEDRMD